MFLQRCVVEQPSGTSDSTVNAALDGCIAYALFYLLLRPSDGMTGRGRYVYEFCGIVLPFHLDESVTCRNNFDHGKL